MMHNTKKYSTGHALFLKGRRGAKIIEEINNGPVIPYEYLKKESQECINRIKQRRKDSNDIS